MGKDKVRDLASPARDNKAIVCPSRNLPTRYDLHVQALHAIIMQIASSTKTVRGTSALKVVAMRNAGSSTRRVAANNRNVAWNKKASSRSMSSVATQANSGIDTDEIVNTISEKWVHREQAPVPALLRWCGFGPRRRQLGRRRDQQPAAPPQGVRARWFGL